MKSSGELILLAIEFLLTCVLLSSITLNRLMKETGHPREQAIYKNVIIGVGIVMITFFVAWLIT